MPIGLAGYEIPAHPWCCVEAPVRVFPRHRFQAIGDAGGHVWIFRRCRSHFRDAEIEMATREEVGILSAGGRAVRRASTSWQAEESVRTSAALAV